MKTYIGTSDGMGSEVGVHTDNGLVYPLDPRFDLANHSPTGFSWGYWGSGPAQLALAILADHQLDDESALAMYHEFMRAMIAPLDQKKNFTIDGEEIDAWIKR